MSLYGIAVIPVLIWIYLLIGRGRFWRLAPQRADGLAAAAARRVVVLIPARNEAAVIATTVASLARQSFNGVIHLIVIDDDSTDGTAEAALARRNLERAHAVHRLRQLARAEPGISSNARLPM